MIKSVKIGAMTYKVVEKDDLHYVNDDGKKCELYGDITHSAAEIRLKADQSDQQKIPTLVHEIVHGLLNQAGMDEHPEQAVRVLGYGLVQVIRDNPELIDLIQHGERHKLFDVTARIYGSGLDYVVPQSNGSEE